MRHTLIVTITLALFWAAGCSLLPAAEPQVVGPNVVRNGGFEDGLKDWDGRGEIVADQVSAGRSALRLDTTGGQGRAGIRQAKVPVEPGKYYRFAMAVRRTTGQEFLNVQAFWQNRQGEDLGIMRSLPLAQMLGPGSVNEGPPGQWETLSGAIRNDHPDVGAIELAINLRGEGGLVHVDEVRLEEIRFPEAPAWVFPDAVVLPGKPSRFGMKVEGLQQDGDKFTINTTGASFVFDAAAGTLTCGQRLGQPRPVVTATFTGLSGPWTASVNNEDVVVLQSPQVALGFQGDSLVTIAANKELPVRLQAEIGAEYLQRLDPFLLAIDAGGGFCAMPYDRPFLHSPGTSLKMSRQSTGKPGWSVDYRVGEREMLGLAVFPGREFRWEQSFTRRVVVDNDVPTFEQFQAYKPYANTVVMFAGMYEKDLSGAAHMPYQEKKPKRLQRAIQEAHGLDMQVLAYRHPQSYGWVGMSFDQMLADMKQFRDQYGFDGWYLDGYPDPKDWFATYVTMRRLREEVGDGPLYVHCSGNPPLAVKTIYCPFIDSYADFILRGERVAIQGPSDPYLRWVACTLNISNTFGMLKGTEMTEAPESEEKADRGLQMETMLKLNGRARWAYPKWPLGPVEEDPYRSYYIPELDRQYAEWQKTRQPLPIRWP